MRAGWGNRFAVASLVYVFGLQGLLMVVIASPVLAVMGGAGAPSVTGWDVAGGTLCALGLVIEAVADRQLLAFRRGVDTGDAVLDTGLWRYSRHPNYFGESVFWWGLGLVAVAQGSAWALVGPGLLTVLLLRVSGVALMERSIPKRRPAYADYVARTSAFIPWWPKRVQ
jgi:steroid 5-alpha reductase family enzyme